MDHRIEGAAKARQFGRIREVRGENAKRLASQLRHRFSRTNEAGYFPSGSMKKPRR